ncbi:MAG TPA: hypothetical protein VK837_09135 [Longimicrobiales bacterium]|nr:hypothetical protein [Longimicrobiales bacterium]
MRSRRWTGPRAAAFAALAWGIGGAGVLAAQGQGRGNQQTVAVSQLADLTFGIVIGGTPSVIRPDDPDAAQFEVTLRGQPPHAVTVTLALPRELTSGPNRLPIRFDAASAAWATRDAPNARTLFDPAVGTTVTLDQRGPKAILVWIGGVLEPTASQPSGDYADRITLIAVEN